MKTWQERRSEQERKSELEEHSIIGHAVIFRGNPIGKVVDEVQVTSRGCKHCIERIHQFPEARKDNEEYAYRFCYYAPSENGSRVFGQYGTLFPQRELRELLRLAHEKGWPIFP